MAEDFTAVSDADAASVPQYDHEDPEFLARHRRALLKAQDLTVGALAAQAKAPWRGDLAIAIVYTLYALPLSAWVLWQARHDGGMGPSLAVIALVALFGRALWRAYARSLRGIKRGRIYEGRFVGAREATNVVEFEGGKIRIPPSLEGALVPGVRYRVHGEGTEDVAIDVAVDEVDVDRGIYR